MSTAHRELEARVVRKIHGGLTLDLTIRLGREIGVLFGPSGAGKTSALRSITGLERPDAGSIRLGDSVLFDSLRGIDEPLRRRRIGMIFQDDLLFPHLSVAANITFGLRRAGQAAREARLAEVAALCGVDHLLGRLPAALSGGERQRVGLARALAPRPRLLLCDEPVSALDLPNRHALLDRLRAIQTREGIPVLYVTHSPAEAIAVGSTLFYLERGGVIAEGPPLDVLSSVGGRSFIRLEGVRNTFPARIEDHARDHGETRLRIDDGPILIVPFLDHPPGTPVLAEVRAEDILLARGPVAGLSARNLIAGVVERVVPHGREAEVVVRTGKAAWIASVIAPAVQQLSLSPGADVHMIIKARSCHVSTSPPLS